jgi:uncharacterized protein YjbJ (UPF0337 family)
LAQGAPAFTKEPDMNSNQIKGAVKDAAGKIRRTAGEVTGSKEQQVKGAADQVEGKTQKALGDVQENLKDATRRP